jgi:hypothetical protein
MQLDRPYDTMGMSGQQFKVREVWTGKVLDITGGRLNEKIPPHAVLLLKLSR